MTTMEKFEDLEFINDIVARIQRGENNVVDTKKVSAINYPNKLGPG